MIQLYMLNIITEEATYIRPASNNQRYYGSYKAKWSEKERLQIVFDTFEDVRAYLYARFSDEWLNAYCRHHKLTAEEATIKDHMTRAIEDWRLNPDNLMPEVTLTFKDDHNKHGIIQRIIINDESVTMIPYVPHTNEEEE